MGRVWNIHNKMGEAMTDTVDGTVTGDKDTTQGLVLDGIGI